MTLGEKIRYARKCRSLSQEQLAEKMCVSRSAIAKWETDKGLPDIENLKTLSRLLGISVDALLDDSTDRSTAVIREPYALSAYGRGCQKVKKSRLIQDRFPDANICTLLGRPILGEEDATVSSSLGILTPAPFGSPAYLKSVKDLNMDFYLVERDGDQIFVTVTDQFLEIRLLEQPPIQKSFRIGSWLFIRGIQLTGEERDP